MTIFCDSEFPELMYYKDGEEYGDYMGRKIGCVKEKDENRAKEISDMYYSGDGIRILTKEQADKIYDML